MRQKLEPRQALSILISEIESRERQTQSELVDLNFPEQAAFVRDSSTFITACTTRRAGKSSALAYKFFRAARKHKDVMMPYIALTRDSAKNIMWPVLKEIAAKERIQAKFTDSNLTCEVSETGSTIKLFGADTKGFMEKIRGIKTPLAAVDEVQSFRAHIEQLVDDILSPAISDFGDDGQLVLTGTPGPVPKGYFHDITEQGLGGFSYHHWSSFNNPYIKSKEFVEKLMSKKGWTWDHPTIQREWLGKWVADFDALCYKFSDSVNRVRSIPETKSNWIYVFGIDLGYDDPTAFVIGAYNEFDPHLYIIETYKQSQMIISDVVGRIKYYQRIYPNAYIIMDAADKQAVEEMKQRYGVPIEAAEKHGKAGFIELMNSDLRNGLVKVVGENNEELVEEWQNLIWDQDSEKRIEDSRYANHLTDGALYLWRYCYNFLWKDRPKEISIHSEEKTDLWWEQQAERLQDEQRRQRELENEAFGNFGFG